ncbi:MAG: serine O-acetyltransferase [Ruminococcus sp.]|nr:serine O-acetyltransferase [Ruminococcus sp.]
MKGGASLFRKLKEDIAVVKEKDPAARSSFEILLTYSGLKAVRSYRRAHWFYTHGFYTIARIISQRSRHKTGIEIHPGAQIGKGLFIDHGMGVVIGETTIIGDNCLLYQGVTLGGTGKDKGKRHPTLGNNVMVGAGAKVLGPIEIGDNVKVAANAVVLKPIPANCTAVGVPARVAVRDGVKIEHDLDHVHYPDPTMQDITELRTGMQQLRSEVDTLEHQYEVDHEHLEQLEQLEQKK